MLVDIRATDRAAQDGVPELKRGALGKGASVPLINVSPGLARRVRNADALAIDVLAASVASLRSVSRGTSVIIMDNQVQRARL